jgi:ketosteroid isomerase-like protein
MTAPLPEADAHAAILAANTRFYAAFEALDLEVMGQIWSESQAISCVHPGWTLLSGREPVLASWAGIFRGTEGIRFELREPQVFVAGSTGWVVLLEMIEAKQEGAVVRALAQTTNVFVLEGGAWRLVHHHAAPAPPVEPAPPAEEPPPDPGRILH